MKRLEVLKALQEEQRINPEYGLVFVVGDEEYVVSDEEYAIDSYGDGKTKVKLVKA